MNDKQKALPDVTILRKMMRLTAMEVLTGLAEAHKDAATELSYGARPAVNDTIAASHLAMAKSLLAQVQSLVDKETT